MAEERLTACDLFNHAVEAFRQSDVARAVVCLRRGFFENLYISPLLLGEPYHPQEIWYPSAESEPRAATEYLRRYGRLWDSQVGAREFLREIWQDPLVRHELRSYLNLAKNLLNAPSRRQADELLRERELFISERRIERTQAEIIQRLSRSDVRVPAAPPRFALILLAARDPIASVEFYRQLFSIEPVHTSQTARGYAEFEIEGVHVAIHGHDRLGKGDPYALGEPPSSLGWGALFIVQVADVEIYYENAVRADLTIVDSDFAAGRHRFFVVKDPSGYLFELTESEPRGLEFS